MADEQQLLARITVNPDIFRGKPIVRGRRLAVEHVLGMLAAGDSAETILEGYPWLEPEDIQACLTLDHDLGAKLSHYRRIPSVRQVLFVHVEQRAVTLVARRDAGTWTLFDGGPTGAVELVGGTLSLDAIYAGTDSLPA